MKLQHLAVIFVIIILTITLLLNGYTDSQIKTLRLQLSYDEKLALNDYHKTVYQTISPYLTKKEKAWLQKYTREI